jgi:hypothetical protein
MTRITCKNHNEQEFSQFSQWTINQAVFLPRSRYQPEIQQGVAATVAD